MVHYGFELPWTYLFCLNCETKYGYSCDNTGGNDYVCSNSSSYDQSDQCSHRHIDGTYYELNYFPCGLRCTLRALIEWIIYHISNIGWIFGKLYVKLCNDFYYFHSLSLSFLLKFSDYRPNFYLRNLMHAIPFFFFSSSNQSRSS